MFENNISMIKQEDVYQIGRMGKAHGLKGEINFQFSDDLWDRTDCDYLICEVEGMWSSCIRMDKRSARNSSLYSSMSSSQLSRMSE